MSKESKYISEDLWQEISLSKSEVPSTDGLQASIIAQAASTPQVLGNTQAGAKRSDSFLGQFKLRKWLLPSAFVLASLSLAVVFQPMPVSTPIEPTITSSSLSDAELEWQEFMLSEDEFLFAEVAAN